MKAFSVVVFPEPVPPLISTFRRSRMASTTISRTRPVIVPEATNCAVVNQLLNLRMVSVAPPGLHGG